MIRISALAACAPNLSRSAFSHPPSGFKVNGTFNGSLQTDKRAESQFIVTNFILLLKLVRLGLTMIPKANELNISINLG
jgi:hypothetical protein